jgi:hypothetical protein
MLAAAVLCFAHTAFAALSDETVCNSVISYGPKVHDKCKAVAMLQKDAKMERFDMEKMFAFSLKVNSTQPDRVTMDTAPALRSWYIPAFTWLERFFDGGGVASQADEGFRGRDIMIQALAVLLFFALLISCCCMLVKQVNSIDHSGPHHLYDPHHHRYHYDPFMTRTYHTHAQRELPSALKSQLATPVVQYQHEPPTLLPLQTVPGPYGNTLPLSSRHLDRAVPPSELIAQSYHVPGKHTDHFERVAAALLDNPRIRAVSNDEIRPARPRQTPLSTQALLNYHHPLSSAIVRAPSVEALNPQIRAPFVAAQRAGGEHRYMGGAPRAASADYLQPVNRANAPVELQAPIFRTASYTPRNLRSMHG